MLISVLVLSLMLAQDLPACAVVTGDDPTTASIVKQALLDRGITDHVIDGCTLVNASIERKDAGFRIHLVDGQGHIITRTAKQIDGVVTVIESWSRRDLSRPLWDRPDASLGLRAYDNEIPAAYEQARTRVSSARSELNAAAGSAVASDGSVWFGVEAGACRRWGPTCTGMALRLSNDRGIRGSSAMAKASRRGLDAWALLDIPFTFKSVRVDPGIALGPGWLHTRQFARLSPEYVEAATADTFGVRANAHLSLSVPVNHNLSLLWGVQLEVAAFNRPDVNAPGTNVLVIHSPATLLRSTFGVRYEGL